jgi:putative mRNA 3-end processing factor
LPGLIQFTKKGIYCPAADVYIDPWQRVDRALITHAHSDHARPGNSHYLSHHNSVNVLKLRLGNINIQSVEYGEVTNINGIDISFHPAGHVVGSAQIRIADDKEVWVISGDYKLQNDNISTPFEPIKCDYYVTESTFGIPAFQWEPQDAVINKINQWWSSNIESNKPSIISAYSLGKAQRIIQNVDHHIGPIYTHGAVENTNEAIRSSGISLKATEKLTDFSSDTLKNALIVCPPGAIDSSWSKKIKNHSVGVASGWMALRGTRRRRHADNSFVLSDHADWNTLNKSVDLSGAHTVYVTHGYTEIFSRWLREKGLQSEVLSTSFEGEVLEQNS